MPLMDEIQQAMSLRDAGRPDSALAKFREIFPSTQDGTHEQAMVLLGCGTSLDMLSRFAEAHQFLDKIDERHGADVCALRDSARATLLMDERRWWDALQLLEKLVKENSKLLGRPGNEDLRSDVDYRRGLLWAICGDAKRAKPLLLSLRNGRQSSEEECQIAFYLGWCLLQEGATTPAQQQFQQVLATSKDDELISLARKQLFNCVTGRH